MAVPAVPDAAVIGVLDELREAKTDNERQLVARSIVITRPLRRLIGTGAAEVLVAALEACGNNEFGGSITYDIARLLAPASDSHNKLRGEFIAAGVIQALVRRLPCTGGGGSTSAAEALMFLCLESAEIAQEVRDTPGVLEAVSALPEATGITQEASLLQQLHSIKPTGRLTKVTRAAEPAPASGKEEEEEEQEE